MQHLDNQTSLVTSMIACTAEVLPHKFCGARYIHIRGIKTHLQHSHDKNWKRLQHNAGSTNLFFLPMTRLQFPDRPKYVVLHPRLNEPFNQTE